MAWRMAEGTCAKYLPRNPWRRGPYNLYRCNSERRMRWRGRQGSSNIEDRRGVRFGRAGGIGIGTILLALVAIYFGQDPSVVLQGVQPSGPVSEEGPYQETPEEAQLREFVSVVLADTEETWGQIFDEAGGTYEQPKLVLFSGAVESACGFAQAAVGPFYCPADRKVYIDLSFCEDLQDRFGAPGDFAQAYVVAHEIGHHVQTLTGISERNMAARQRAGEAEANALSVRQELQADCFAGIWAHNADRSRQLLEQGDIEEGLNAAAAIGDDRLQQQARGYVAPESFTHGSSEQRVRWFKRGFETGSVQSCDTFAANSL
jgi:predicted metalloprotease